jgi:DNA-binding protein HU-beta
LALADLIDAVADLAKVGKREAKSAMDAVLNAIVDAVQSGPVRTAIGTFSVSERKARKGRNPRTGEAVNIPASKSIKFKPSKAVRDRIGSRKGGGGRKAGAARGGKTPARGTKRGR